MIFTKVQRLSRIKTTDPVLPYFFYLFKFQEIGIRKSLCFVVVVAVEKNLFCLVRVRSMIDSVADFKSSNCEIFFCESCDYD